jgi:hypothetical protein
MKVKHTMEASQFIHHVREILANPQTESSMIDRLAHDCLIGILNHRDINQHEGEMELDRLLKDLQADLRYIDQTSLKHRIDALY